MLAKSQLLEPWYAFRLELPSDNVGRAMNDIQNMGGSFDPPETGADGDTTLLTGTAPASHHAQLPHGGGGLHPGQGTPESDAGRLPPLPQCSRGHRGRRL